MSLRRAHATAKPNKSHFIQSIPMQYQYINIRHVKISEIQIGIGILIMPEFLIYQDPAIIP